MKSIGCKKSKKGKKGKTLALFALFAASVFISEPIGL